MFSSKNLISFVFANENDTYYRDDMLKLNQDQYLWYQLHEKFETVYFLREAEGQLQVRSFGDRNGPCPTFKSKLFKTAEDQQGKWLLQQMRRKAADAVAFVCTLPDFCSVFSKASWEETLRELAESQNRTGIFVVTASATAERNTKLLLTSPVFQYLKENAILEQRSGEPRDLYGSIAQKKWGSCFFLNEFTYERVHALLVHVIMKYPERLESIQDLDELAAWLHKYLNSATLPGNDTLFDFKLPVNYLTHEDVYTLLCKENIWNRLIARVNQGTVPKIKECSHHILRDSSSYAGRYLQLKLPNWVNADSQDGIRVYRLVREIRDAISSPKNKLENQFIQQAADRFLCHLDTVPNDDAASYKGVLDALKLCVDWMYVANVTPQAKQMMEITRNQMELLNVLRRYYALEKNLRYLLLQNSDHALHQKAVVTMKAELQSLEKMRSIYEEIIQIASWELTVPSTEHSMQRLKELTAKLEAYRNKKDTKPEPEPQCERPQDPPAPVKQEPEPEQGFRDEDLVLRPEDACYIPPTT